MDTDKYHAETLSTGSYTTLPQPYTTSGIGLPPGVPDTRFPADLPNGPYQISKYVPYAAYTGDPVHRFFQMWQDFDGGRLDKLVWVEETIGTGANFQAIVSGDAAFFMSTMLDGAPAAAVRVARGAPCGFDD